jgi:hypothetical protein
MNHALANKVGLCQSLSNVPELTVKFDRLPLLTVLDYLF